MTKIAFKRVTLDHTVDPIRITYRWWDSLADQAPTRFAVWIKSGSDVDRNVLLAAEFLPGQEPTTFVHEFATGRRCPAGRVVEWGPGRLIVEFPVDVLAEYGPIFSWWGLLTVGDDDVDTYHDEDASNRALPGMDGALRSKNEDET